MYNHIDIELQGVHQALQSNCAVSIKPLTTGTVKPGDEPTQLHQITDTIEALLLRAQEETTQAIQALMQVKGLLVEQRSASKQEKLGLQAQWDNEKA
jgi:hypothetical protein